MESISTEKCSSSTKPWQSDRKLSYFLTIFYIYVSSPNYTKVIKWKKSFSAIMLIKTLHSKTFSFWKFLLHYSVSTLVFLLPQLKLSFYISLFNLSSHATGIGFYILSSISSVLSAADCHFRFVPSSLLASSWCSTNEALPEIQSFLSYKEF